MTADTRTTEIATLLARLTEIMADQHRDGQRQEPARQRPERVLLTVEEAAERLNRGRTKVFALVKSGAIQSVQVGRLRRIHVDEVKAYAAQLVADQTAA